MVKMAQPLRKVIILFILLASWSFSIPVFGQDPAKEITQLCKKYSDLRLHKPYEAIAVMQKAIEISRRYNFPDSLINIYSNIGNVYQSNKIYPLALEAYFNKLKAAENAKDLNSIAFCYSDIGNTYYAQNVFSVSYSYYQKAAEIFRRTGYSIGLSVALNNQALVLMKWKKFNDAIALLKESLEVREKTGIKELIAHSHSLLGATYSEMSDYADALSHFEQSNAIFSSLSEPQNVAKNMKDIARIYSEKKNFPSAISYCRKALILFESKNIWIYHPEILNQMAGFQLANQQYAEAEKSCLQALKIARDNQTWIDQQQSLQLLSKIAVAQNNPLKAIEYLQANIAIKDTLMKQLNDDNFNKLKIAVSTYKEEKEKEALQRENSRSKDERNILIFALALFIGLAVSIFQQVMRSRKQQSTILKQQKAITELELKHSREETLRLEMVLDNRNRELVVKSMAIAQNNERLGSIIEQLQLIRTEKSNLDKRIGSMISTLRHNITVESWEEFQLRFEKVHPDFYQKLEHRFPDLSAGEEKLCALLYLNLSTKEISAITSREAASIDVSRSRLRKKLGLNRDENLVRFLSELQ